MNKKRFIIPILIIAVIGCGIGYFYWTTKVTTENWRTFRNEPGVQENFYVEGFGEGFDEGFKEKFEIKLPKTWVAGGEGGVYNFRDNFNDITKNNEPVIQIGIYSFNGANFDDEFVKLISYTGGQNLKHTTFNGDNAYEYDSLVQQVFNATTRTTSDRKTFEVWMEHKGLVYYIIFNNRHRDDLSAVEKKILASFKILE